MTHFTCIVLAFPSNSASFRPEPLLSVLSQGTYCPGPWVGLSPWQLSLSPPPSSCLYSLPPFSTSLSPSSVTAFSLSLWSCSPFFMAVSGALSSFLTHTNLTQVFWLFLHLPYWFFSAFHLISFQYLLASTLYFYLLFPFSIVSLLENVGSSVLLMLLLSASSFVGLAPLKHLLRSGQCAKCQGNKAVWARFIRWSVRQSSRRSVGLGPSGPLESRGTFPLGRAVVGQRQEKDWPCQACETTAF